jgi:hypothetical protein
MSKSFRDWTRDELLDCFNLHKKEGVCTELNEWLAAANDPIDTRKREDLEELRLELIDNVDGWNEEELKILFIGRLVSLVKFNTPKYKIFFERSLFTTLNGIELKGNVDAVIATARYNKPRAPFFCFHEYKAEDNTTTQDVRGQLLAEMLAAQVLNADGKIIYGSYLFGRLWFFGTLIGDEFCFSNGFVADGDDIFKIYNILRKLKDYFDERG